MDADWFFGFAIVNDVVEDTRPRQLRNAAEADEIGAWPGLLTFGPFPSREAAEERLAKMRGEGAPANVDNGNQALVAAVVS